MDMHNDISKRTVLVLLVLTLVVSVVGTWTVLSMPKEIHKTVEIGPPQEAKVKLGLNPPTEPVVDSVSGRVALKIGEPR